MAFVLSAAVAGSFATAPVAPAQAAVTSSSGQWIWEGTTRTVGNVADGIDLDDLRAKVTTTGKGVGIALIDTGVAAVPGLTSGNVVNGPDLSFDSQDATKRYLDGYGHGTHLAGIISARSAGLTGLAPDAKLTSIKVGSSNGAVDVSQVIAALDWAVAHRNDDLKNPIRVICLAYGTDSVQSYQIDPLAAAAENAWRAGIVVLVAGGNGGPTSKLLAPATDPFLMAVGATDDNITTIPGDDTVASFSTVGTSTRKLDIAAPGRSIVSLRAPGSYIDTAYPAARIGTSYFVGSGSSQATAVTAGAIALLLQLRPEMTPDQIKKVLRYNGYRMPITTAGYIYRLSIAMAWANYVASPSTYTGAAIAQNFTKSTGTGSLEGSRGSVHVTADGVMLSGENDIFGPFSTKTWAAASATKTAWNGGTWMGRDMTGTGWTTASSGLTSWTGRAWFGRAWFGRAWSGDTWASIIWLSGRWS